MMQNIPPRYRQPFIRPAFLLAAAIVFISNGAAAQGLPLTFPLACEHGRTCWVMNYMDADIADGSARDFRCGPRTQDGKQSTDIAVRDIATADYGVAVLAAADGEVVRMMDGIDDRFLSKEETDMMERLACGNMILIDHGGGWQSGYCHLKNGSLRVAPGERVRAGQMIGEVGLSGVTSWPSLGFTIGRNGTPYDPFTGRTAREGCGLSERSMWIEPEKYPYRAFAIYNLGFDVTAPQESRVDRGMAPVVTLPADSPSLSFWATMFDAVKGDVVDMRVTDPRGNELMAISAPLPDDQKKRLVSVTQPRVGLWEPGVYTGIIRVTRGVGQSAQISEWAAQVVLE